MDLFWKIHYGLPTCWQGNRNVKFHLHLAIGHRGLLNFIADFWKLELNLVINHTNTTAGLGNALLEVRQNQ